MSVTLARLNAPVLRAGALALVSVVGLVCVLGATCTLAAPSAHAVPACVDAGLPAARTATSSNEPRSFPLDDGRAITADGKIVAAAGNGSGAKTSAKGSAKAAEKCSPYPEKDAASGKFGYRKDDGQWFLQPTFKSALAFHFGRAVVILDAPEQTRSIGKDTERFTPCSYVRLDGSRLAVSFARCGAFTGGLAQVDGIDGSFGMIDRNGALVLPYVQPAYWRHATAVVSEGLIALRDAETDKIGYANEQGEWVIKPQFAQGFEHHEGLAAVTQKDGGKVGFIDRTGRLVIPYRYGTNFGEPPVFSEGLALLAKDNYFPLTNLDPPARLGFIDRKGAWKITPRFSSGAGFVGGLAHVYQGEKESYIDRSGKAVWPKK